jgi:MFS family permease
VGALAAISFLNDAASEMMYPLLPLFLVGPLGAGPAFLGIIEGIAESTASLTKLAGGFLSDRLGKRKVLVGWGYGVAAVIRPFMAIAAAPWHVLVIRFTDRVGKGVRTAPRDALLVESAPKGRTGAAFGLHRAADHAGSVLGPLVAALILFLLPGELRLVFALTAIPGILAVVVVIEGVREVRRGGSGAEPGALDASAPEASAPTPEDPPEMEDAPEAAPEGAGAEKTSLRDLGPAFPRYLVVLLLFTLGNASDAFLLLRAQDLGVPVVMIPLLWGAFHVSKMLWSVPGGILSDRFRPSRVIVSGWVFYALVYAGFAVATAAWQAWALFLVYGLFYGLTESPEKALVATLSPKPLLARAYGIFHFSVGLAALPASLIFGFLWQVYGASTAFFFGAGVALVAALLLPLALLGSGGAKQEINT